MDAVKARCFQHLRRLEHAPNVGILDYVPRDFFSIESIDARKLHKASHDHEAEVEDGQIEF